MSDSLEFVESALKEWRKLPPVFDGVGIAQLVVPAN
jgi:hypothetical protein